jgi:hypothetical protein
MFFTQSITCNQLNFASSLAQVAKLSRHTSLKLRQKQQLFFRNTEAEQDMQRS